MTNSAPPPEGVTTPPGDDEEFCPKCFAGIESSEHHAECIAPLDQLDDWDLAVSRDMAERWDV